MTNDVELIGYYGSDITHSLAAWTSTNRELTVEKRARIPKLLKMLAEEGHHTPFERSFFHFLVIVDTASHIHILKHRIGVSANGESARYKELKEDKYYVPEDWPEKLKADYTGFMKESYFLYHNAISTLEEEGFTRKRAKESARFFLPYGNQLKLDVTFNFRSLMHFQSLRNKDNAQLEIRAIANHMLLLVKETGDFDYSLEAFGYGRS